jgi:hypothetical protein
VSRRLAIHERLVEALGISKQVYYQPPENITLKYPAIVYRRLDIDMDYAANGTYQTHPKYRVMVISKTPDHPAVDKIVAGQYASFVSHYVADGLNHDIIDIYNS